MDIVWSCISTPNAQYTGFYAENQVRDIVKELIIVGNTSSILMSVRGFRFNVKPTVNINLSTLDGELIYVNETILILTHCGLVTPCGHTTLTHVVDCLNHCWLISRCAFCLIHLGAIPHKVLCDFIRNMPTELTRLKVLLYLPGINELRIHWI